jgi:hypothetical protein
MWLFEGVRDGSYHVVYRHSPDPGPFTQMVGFLAKNLAKVDDSWIPRGGTSPDSVVSTLTRGGNSTESPSQLAQNPFAGCSLSDSTLPSTGPPKPSGVFQP